MITTYEITPSPLLAPFVRSYVYREFDTKGMDCVKPKHATEELALHFFFKGLPVKLVDTATGLVLKTGKKSGVSGMSSQYVGEMTFNGVYSFFEIGFRAHGFNVLFNVPASKILNDILWSEEIFDSSINLLHEQLAGANCFAGMVKAADNYLLKRLHKHKHVEYKSGFNFIVQTISDNNGLVDIDNLAYDANMSIRNFERRFLEETGMPPKLYCCITRFNKALSVKLKNPNWNWTTVAHHSGYFDQMHLIKDFKRFAGEAPLTLLKNTPLLQEHYVED